MNKKIISLTLAMIMFFRMSLDILAYSNMNVINDKKCVVNEETIYIDDEDGNKIPVTITETIYVDPNNTEISPMDLTPKYKIGETRTYSVKISNEAMGIPSLVGAYIPNVAKKKAAEIAAKAITSKVGSSLIPGLNIASVILSSAAMANALTGKDGIKITVVMKYKRMFLNHGGYYVYGWGTSTISISRY